MKFEVGKQYKTRVGWRAIVLKRLIADSSQGLVWIDGLDDTIVVCLRSGKYLGVDGKDYDHDLIEEWKEPKQYSGWVNVYGVKHSDGVITGECIYETKEAAGSGAFSKGRIACIKIDFQERDGIETT
jgi:hypothetical protein